MNIQNTQNAWYFQNLHKYGLNITEWIKEHPIPKGTERFGEMADAVRKASQMSSAKQAMACTGQKDWKDNSNIPFLVTPTEILEVAYEDWCEGREPLTLPEDGSELADFLRERYTGPMSENERLEVLLALRDSNYISGKEYRNAAGIPGQLILVGRYDPKTGEYTPLEHKQPVYEFKSWAERWEDIHVNSVMAKCKNIDDILTWLTKQNPGLKPDRTEKFF